MERKNILNIFYQKFTKSQFLSDKLSTDKMGSVIGVRDNGFAVPNNEIGVCSADIDGWSSARMRGHYGWA